MKIIVEIRRETLKNKEMTISVELNKLYNKVQLLNIADDVTKCLLSNGTKKFEEILTKYGRIESAMEKLNVNNVNKNKLEFLVLFASNIDTKQKETLYNASTSLVVGDFKSEIAKLWLFY